MELETSENLPSSVPDWVDEDTPLDYDTTKRLLQEGFNPLINSASLLFAVVERNDESILNLLLKSCQSSRVELLNIRNEVGMTLLQVASGLGHLQCASLLLSAGFSEPVYINMVNDEGDTALLLASRGGHTSLSRLLLGSGARPNISNNRGNYPVHIAASHGNLLLLQELSQHKADMRVRNRRGNTLLHVSSHPIVMEYLHSCGVDPMQRNSSGLTALELAYQSNAHTDILNTLRQLEVKEHRNQQAKDYGLLMRSVYQVKWFVVDTSRQLGLMVTLLVIVLLLFLSWQLAVYIHGRSPLYLNTLIDQNV